MNDGRFYSFLGIIKKSGRLVYGYNNCECDIKKEKCNLVIIAKDASDNTIKKFVNMCVSRGLPYIIHGEKENLGICISKPPVSVLGIKDEGMSKAVLNMLEQ